MIALLRLLMKLGLIGGLVLGFFAWQEQKEWEESVLQAEINKVPQKESELSRKVQEVKDAQAFLTSRDQKQKELIALKEEVDKQAKSVPQKASLPALLSALADRSDITGLEFSRFNPQAEVKFRFLVLTPFTVSLRGTYTQIMSFLDAAANMERAVTTESLILDSPSSPKGGASILNATAVMVAYHIDAAELANPASAAPEVKK